jgi:hypothetical protein
MTELLELRAQIDGQLRTQTLLDDEFLIIPVIAMVEGVRFGATQTKAELGLADDFARLPVSWNTSPVVLGHPKVGSDYVSAKNSDILQQYALGSVFNTQRKGKKLYMEAWLNKKYAENSPEHKAMFERVSRGEVVEVSVGMYADVVPSTGSYEGQAYTGVWQNVIPDHLALLSNEIGACSIENGCGTNRVQTKIVINSECSCKKTVDSTENIQDNMVIEQIQEETSRMEDTLVETPVQSEPVKQDPVPTPVETPSTLEAVINAAPKQFQDILKESVALYNQQRTDLIAKLEATGRCKLEKSYLQVQSITTLQHLTALAAVPTYSGVAAPQAVVQADEDAVPAAPLVFG